MPTPTMLCKLCEKIAISVQRPSEQREILEPVWSYDFAQRNTQCSTCQHLSEAFKNRQGWSSRCNCLDQSCEPDWKVCIQFNTGYDCWMMILSPCGGTCEDYLYNPTLLMVQILKEPDIKEGVAVAIGQQSIDLGRIKRRMDTCDASHAGFCHSLVQPYEKVERATNLHFIDVERRCLVDQPNQECQYLALSYVWGPAINPFQTLISNYSQLSKDGAFDLPANRARLPKTIQDSMLLTRSLGIKYIWIDRFCIIQDDIAAKPSQLAAMASIYANAYFTIAASEGEDGDFGLPGLSSSSPRQPPYCEFQFTPECHMVERNPTLSADSWDGARYHTRGWTLQEYVLSRRILVFHHQTVSWVCQVDSVQENGVEPQERAVPNLRTNFLHSLIWTSWPNIRSYANMVETYSRRELTNQDDALNAFDAFITVQGRPMEGGMFYGIPELFFGAMLLWEPFDYEIVRRTDYQGHFRNEFPSWSWCGWVGLVDMLFAVNVYNYLTDVINQIPITAHHIIDFYKVPKPGSGASRERIRDIHYHNSKGLQSQKMDNAMLPNNWTFQHPIPLVQNATTNALRSEALYSPIIEFRTRHLFAHLVTHDTKKDSLKNPFIVSHPGSEVIGYLHTATLFLNTPLPTKPVELICIGKMEVDWCATTQRISPGVRYLHRNCPKGCHRHKKELCKLGQNWKWEVYNVLWVEWHDGVAYRKAVGKVWTHCWDDAQTEGVDVRLG